MHTRLGAGGLARLLVPCSLTALLAVPSAAADEEKEERQVSGFHSVVLKTAGDLRITQGDRESLIAEAETTVLPKIATVVRDGVLHIEGKASPIITQLPIRFTLSVRELRVLQVLATGAVELNRINGKALTIDASGSSNIDGSRLDLGELRLTISGSGNVALEGKVKRQELRISGAGTYDAARLMSQHAKIRSSGAGNVSVNASQTLDVAISGSGEVRYSGHPELRQDIVGAGSLRRAADWPASGAGRGHFRCSAFVRYHRADEAYIAQELNLLERKSICIAIGSLPPRTKPRRAAMT